MQRLINMQFVLSAFAGGAVLSIMELAAMFQHKEVPDKFFFGGMLIAGLIGVIGYVLSKAVSKSDHSTVNAFMSGIAAPQFLGGLVKVGSTTATAVTMLFMPAAYATTRDSVKVVAVVQGVDSAELTVKGKTYKLSDVTKLVIQRQDSITVTGNGFSERIAVPKKKEVVLKIEMVDQAPTEVQQEQKAFQGKYLKIMRGMFAQKYEQKQAEPQIVKKIQISIE
jgi:hypothetical protein